MLSCSAQNQADCRNHSLHLIIRELGLSGRLTDAQSVYANIYVVDALWPDFELAHVDSALEWFKQQDRTLGG
jgi:undecaprenyl diphosphate synthase